MSIKTSSSIKIERIVMEYFLDAIKKYADFSGRATRKEYWMFVLFYMIIFLLLSVVDGLLETFILGTIFSLAVLVPSVSIAARRLHDIGRTGWWLLITLIPVIGIIILIVFLTQNSQDGNAYGPSSKLV